MRYLLLAVIGIVGLAVLAFVLRPGASSDEKPAAGATPVALASLEANTVELSVPPQGVLVPELRGFRGAGDTLEVILYWSKTQETWWVKVGETRGKYIVDAADPEAGTADLRCGGSFLHLVLPKPPGKRAPRSDAQVMRSLMFTQLHDALRAEHPECYEEDKLSGARVVDLPLLSQSEKDARFSRLRAWVDIEEKLREYMESVYPEEDPVRSLLSLQEDQILFSYQVVYDTESNDYMEKSRSVGFSAEEIAKLQGRGTIERLSDARLMVVRDPAELVRVAAELRGSDGRNNRAEGAGVDLQSGNSAPAAAPALANP